MLIIFADTPGLLRDPSDETSLIGRLSTNDAEHLIPAIGGTGRVKLPRRHEARLRGVGAVFVADGKTRRTVGRRAVRRGNLGALATVPLP